MDLGVQDLLQRQYPMFVQTSPSGNRLLLKTRGTNSFDLFTSEMPSSGFTKIDSSNFTQLSLTWHPNGEQIVFQGFNPSTEMYDLYQITVKTKKKALLDLPNSSNTIPPLRWSDTGRYLAYLSTNKTAHLNIYDFQQKKTIRRIKLTRGREVIDAYTDFQWSGDSMIYFLKDPKKPILTKTNINSGYATYFSLLDKGEIKNFSITQDKILFVGRNHDEEYFQLYEHNVGVSTTTKLTSSNHNISKCRYYDNGNIYFYNKNENGVDKLYCSDSRINGFLLELSSTKGGFEIDLALKNELYLKNSSMEYAPGLIKLDLTNLNTEVKYDPHHAGYLRLKKPELIAVESARGKHKIPCFFWKADYIDIGKKTIIYVHGGPLLQSKPVWNIRTKMFTEYGFNVLAINYRGSAGYSKKFAQSNNEVIQVSDIMESINFLKKRYNINHEEIVLIGSSYGGSLVLQVSDYVNDIGGIVLLSGSFQETKVNTNVLKSTRLFGFYGDLDPLSHEAKRFFEENDLITPSNNNFRIFDSEGHYFHKSSTWADVYRAVIEAFTDSQKKNSYESSL